MINNFAMSLAHILVSEGGYVDHPADPGGRTNYGVTQATWENWVGHPVSERVMRALTIEDVKPLYKTKYWNACQCDSLPNGIDYLVFDFAVNAGVGRAAKTLQSCLGVTPDGAIGPKTIAAATAMDAEELIDLFSDGKEYFYKSLPTFATFGKGWLNRVAQAKTVANQMIA